LPKESKESKLQRALMVAERMSEAYPDAQSALEHFDAYSLLVAVILSAQTTDKAVNQVTPDLFKRWPDVPSLANASQQELADVIKSIGFAQVKAKHLVGAAQMMMSDFSGEVPASMADLTRLPGVGRKTANIVSSLAFGVVEGIAVDTHVFRIATRLRFVGTKADTPDKVETELMKLYPKELWGDINRRWVLFGREFCIARGPRCQICPLNNLCPSNHQQA